MEQQLALRGCGGWGGGGARRILCGRGEFINEEVLRCDGGEGRSLSGFYSN